MSKLTNMMRILCNNTMPIDEVSNKAKLFLKPQISYIEEHYDYIFSIDNKYSVLDLDSLAYTIAIAEELCKYSMTNGVGPSYPTELT